MLRLAVLGFVILKKEALVVKEGFSTLWHMGAVVKTLGFGDTS
jgi:hypothetical protein